LRAPYSSERKAGFVRPETDAICAKQRFIQVQMIAYPVDVYRDTVAQPVVLFLFMAETPPQIGVARIGPSGVLNAVAGNGVRALSGEGVPAATTALTLTPALNSESSGIGMDGAGNLCLAETFPGNPPINRIRKVSAGVLSTVYTIPPLKLTGQVVSMLPPASSAQRDISDTDVAVPPRASIHLVREISLRPPTIVNLQLTRYAIDAPDNGRFELPSLARGTYEIFASLPDISGWDTRPPGEAVRPVAFGRTTFEVLGDSTHVTVTVRLGADVKGRVTIDGRPAAPADLKIHLKPDATAATVEYYRTVDKFRPAIADDGSFLLPAFPEGLYAVGVELPAGSAVSFADVLLDGKAGGPHRFGRRRASGPDRDNPENHTVGVALRRSGRRQSQRRIPGPVQRSRHRRHHRR
jgi:hypothetical protein